LLLLDLAKSFHTPSRAFWFVRRDAHRNLNDEAAASEDDRNFRATGGTTAWDYYLPGHSAGWGGDLDEAMRSYRAALRIDPNHFNSLFFLANRLAKVDRRDEAIAYYAACIVLRPHYVWS